MAVVEVLCSAVTDVLRRVALGNSASEVAAVGRRNYLAAEDRSTTLDEASLLPSLIASHLVTL
jgi:hypothetical protein